MTDESKIGSGRHIAVETRPAGAVAGDGAADDDAIRALVSRLARPHRSGGWIVERAALLAAGSDFDTVIAWIEAHGGKPEPSAAPRSRSGLHGTRSAAASPGGSRPARFVLPGAELDRGPRHPAHHDEESR